MMGGEGRIRAGKKKGGITVSMYNVGGSMGRAVQHREDKYDSTASYYADG